jgi:hypothetical protein
MSVERIDSPRPSTGQTLHRFRCAECSYGASSRAAPERCPMCGGSAWEFEAWRPFSRVNRDLAPGLSLPHPGDAA